MVLLALSLFIFFLISAKPVNSQIPIFYQLLQAYHPVSLGLNEPPSSIVSYSSLAKSTLASFPPTPAVPTVLGVTTSLPPIGGSGKVTTIVVLGDSMIDSLGADIPKLQQALQKLYPNQKFSIINYGYSSTNIDYGLYRLTNNFEYKGLPYQSLISLNPDIVVVESFAYNNFGNTQSGIDRQWLNLGAITTILKEKLPDTQIVLAATIAPNSVIFGNGAPGLSFSALEKIERTKTINLYLQNLINFANSQGFPLTNAYTGSLIDGNGRKDFISSDGIHPSTLGSEFFSQTLARTIHDNNLISP
ncbi:MAG: SGNH/GDSL hydrolase family protein [Candidatus Shapirobacteria bacterium]|jgi:lysophospholipase L1-like esterase